MHDDGSTQFTTRKQKQRREETSDSEHISQPGTDAPRPPTQPPPETPHDQFNDWDEV